MPRWTIPLLASLLLASLLLAFSLPVASAAGTPLGDRIDALESAVEEGRHDEAQALADSLVAVLDGDDLDAAESFQRLGEVIDSAVLGDPTELFRAAYSIRSRQLGDGDERTLESALALAHSLMWRNRETEAEVILERAHEAALAAHDPDDEPFLLLHERLGQLADRRADYARARRHYERALALCLRYDGESSRTIGVLNFRIARLDYILGNNADALERYTRAHDVFAEVLGPEHPNVGLALLDGAAVLSDMENYERSLQDLERARVILEAALPPTHVNLAALYHRFGETEMRRDDLDAALPWLEKALKIREDEQGSDHPNVAATLSKLAQLHRRQGHPQRALPILERKLAIEEQNYGSDHHWYAATLYSMALNLVDLGENDRALEKALHAERIQRDQLRRQTREMPDRTGLMYAADRTVGSGLRIALTLAPQALTSDQIRSVWDAQVDARSFVLDELVYRRRALGDVEDRVVDELREEIAAAARDLARITSSTSDPQDESLRQARTRLEQAERRLAEIDDAFASPARADRVSLADVESALPDRTALIAYCRNENYPSGTFEYVALVRAADGALSAVQLGPAEEIDALVHQWRDRARDPGSGDTSIAAEEACRRAGAALRARIWDPVAGLVGTARIALVVPDAELALVNFAALPTTDDRYLVEDELLVHLLGTERDVVGPAPRADAHGALLALGAPAYDASVIELTHAPTSAPTSERAVEPSRFRGARSGCGAFRETRFAPLPGSAEEVEAIVRHWPGEPIVLTGTEASEASFKSLAPRARVLHMATHGFFLRDDCTVDAPSDREIGDANQRGVGGMAATADSPAPVAPRDNPLTLSGLALAGANTRERAAGDVEDGVLTAEEVAALDLTGLQWAVLSACDTGLGDVHVAEGVLGLRRAFRAAGARTLVLSLWSVDDRATRDWMEALYRARFDERRDTAEAAREASRAILAARRAEGRSTHPFFWGAFIATGDWR